MRFSMIAIVYMDTIPAEEIQHGIDRAANEASRAIRRGLSNEEFHAELYERMGLVSPTGRQTLAIRQRESSNLPILSHALLKPTQEVSRPRSF